MNKSNQTHDIHIKYKITPLNISIYRKALNIWETIEVSENQQYNILVTPHNTAHNWFPKSSKVIRIEPPREIIT